MRRILQSGSAGGALLLVAAIAALVWANETPGAYARVWDADVRHAIDTWLLPAFFLVAGIEIRRELEHPREALLPVIAALGGMAVPALLYLALAGADGWAVPMATDLAFAVGVLSLLGRRVPTTLKVFLLMLAIADDLGAVLVIGVLHGSGVPTTVVAALVGIALPTFAATRIERPLATASTFVVVPLFALASAGVHLTVELDRRVAMAVIVARVVGKVAGITGAAWLATRAGLARLPRDVSWGMIAGVGLLGGMGFTVALYIADISLDDPTGAKAGVLAAAAVSGLLGYAQLTRATRATRAA